MENNKIISDEDEKKIRAMRLGDKNAILWGLKCTGLHYRINAIACAVMYNITDDDIIDSIKELKSETYTLLVQVLRDVRMQLWIYWELRNMQEILER